MIRDLEKYLESIQIQISKILYNQACTLLEEFTDGEVVKLFEKYPKETQAVINKDMNTLLENPEAMQSMIDILIKELRSKHLDRDEYEAMTLDDVRNYIIKLVKSNVNDKSDYVYDVIETLEQCY